MKLHSLLLYFSFNTRNTRSVLVWFSFSIFTFRVRRSRGEMCRGYGRLCVCVCVHVSVCLSLAAFLHYCTDSDVSWGNGKGCPLVVHYWTDLQSVHGFRCYNIKARTRNVSDWLYSLYAWLHFARGVADARCVLVTAVCVSVCVCVSLCPSPHSHTTGQTRMWLGNDTACPLVVHYWADLQSVHGFRCYDNIARTRNVSEWLYSLYAWFIL